MRLLLHDSLVEGPAQRRPEGLVDGPGSLFEVIVGTTVVGMGTGIGYAAIPSMINAHTPPTEIGAANGLNSLFRSLGSTLASAVGGSLLAANTVIIGTFAVPSLSGYRDLFAICGGASLLAALVVLLVPRDATDGDPGSRVDLAEPRAATVTSLD